MEEIPAGAFVQIGQKATRLEDPTEDARELFVRFGVLALRNALEPQFLTMLQRICATATFSEVEREVGERDIETPQRATRALNLAAQRPEFLRWLEQVTECGPLRSVEGRVAQTRVEGGGHLVWHDDLVDPDRRLAIVIRLGAAEYEGGEFELRRKGQPTHLRFVHPAAGSALIFPVSRQFEHRVLPLRSGGPRMVFAGWAFAARE